MCGQRTCDPNGTVLKIYFLIFIVVCNINNTKSSLRNTFVNTGEVEVGGSRIRGTPGLYSKFKAKSELHIVRLCHKTSKARDGKKSELMYMNDREINYQIMFKMYVALVYQDD